MHQRTSAGGRGDIVKVLATGGTIATTTIDGASAARLKGEELFAHVPGGFRAKVVIEDVSRVASWMLGPEEMHAIAKSALDSTRDPAVKGVVVTHGTATLEYTAFLTDLYLDDMSTVVFTGAMRSADATDADGPGNLRHAIITAESQSAKGLGAIVCFAGEIFSAREAWKMKRDSADAFIGTHGLIGTVDDHGSVIRRMPERSYGFDARLEPRVALVKAYPGCDGGQVSAVLDDGARGIVLEGLPGHGGLPPEMHPAVARAVSEGIPVVLASRAPLGRIETPPTGGTGEPLADMGLLSAGDLTVEKAWILLMVVLAQVGSPDQHAARYAQVAG
jgi:L-asparaginase